MSNERLLGGIDVFFPISMAVSFVLDIYSDKYADGEKQSNARYVFLSAAQLLFSLCEQLHKLELQHLKSYYT